MYGIEQGDYRRVVFVLLCCLLLIFYFEHEFSKMPDQICEYRIVMPDGTSYKSYLRADEIMLYENYTNGFCRKNGT